MNDYIRKPMGHECLPPECPADQPHQPGDGKSCDAFRPSECPILKEPDPCPAPDTYCHCPKKPDSTTNCLEELIAKQAAEVLAAPKKEAFKKDLEGLLKAANDSATKYTPDKYKELVAEWLLQDTAIVELIRKLVCAVPCWHCILDCFVCPLLNELHYAEKRLYDDGHLYTGVHDLYDLQYWRQRDTAAKKRTFDRIDRVVKAWGSPADTIGKALTANKALIEAAGKVIGTEPGKAIYDVFLRLVPMHLAIAPPAGPGKTTNIDKAYTEFCECNKGTPDDCCGPDVGELSLRQRLIGPQPYLIDPNDYFMLICCLVEKRYAPAKEELTTAETELAAVGDRIARDEAQFKGEWVKNFETTAKNAIPSVIDCCDYENDDDTEPSPSQSR